MTRGEIWWVDFGEPFGSEPAFRRPAVIVQSDDYNKSRMNTTIVIPITSNLRLANFPGNYLLSSACSKLQKDSVIVTPQITVIDKVRLVEKVSILSANVMYEITLCIKRILEI